MIIKLDDSVCSKFLFPFSLTRHVADIRIGILTIREKWQTLLSTQNDFCLVEEDPEAKLIPANVIPTKDNFLDILSAAHQGQLSSENDANKYIKHPWEIFQLNQWALQKDVELLTSHHHSAELPPGNIYINESNIFIEPGATVLHSILNASDGPIYIAKHAVIMEGSMIRGPFSLGENSVVKMGSKIYGATTVGPNCVVGGEIKNVVFFENSNKAHDGYLGDSVIGAWCNLGAGTSNSNVKNSGSSVSYQWDESTSPMVAGNKAGLLMGDYSRSAINTSFNTGTMVGVCCNVFGDVFHQKKINNFSWGNDRYELNKALRDIDNWKKMKHQALTESEINMLTQLYHSEKIGL